jgi:hypothetical protein
LKEREKKKIEPLSPQRPQSTLREKQKRRAQRESGKKPTGPQPGKKLPTDF